MRLSTPTVLVALVLVAGGCGVTPGTAVDAGSGLPAAGAPAPVGTTDATGPSGPSLATEREEVEAALAEVAQAFRTGDADALRARLHDPDSPFGRRWTDRLEWMRGVPITTYTLELDTSLPDLTTPSLPGDGGLLLNVLEDHQLEGMDALGPLREHLFLTLRQREGRWTVAGDEDGESLGLVSADHLWDQGEVVTTRRGPLMALHHPGQSGIETVLAEAESALATATARWPLAWPERVPVIVPATQEELAELLHVTFDLSNFIAFATTSPFGELGEVTMSGSRVILNTPRFLDRSSETRERILVHELVHAASRPSSSPEVPSWLEEGVAQALGEQRSTTGTRLLDALAAGDWEGELPLDAQFSTGGRDRIFLSYQQGWSFVDHLVEVYGIDAVGTFYREAGAGGVGTPGTAHARVDRAARVAFGDDLRTLVGAWAASL